MNFNNLNPKFLIGIGVVVIVIIGLLLFGLRDSNDGVGSRWEGELEVWGVFDDSDVFENIAEAYEAQTGTTITYTKKAFDTYEKDLIDALAAGRGPDVFMLHNTWVPKHSDKMQPADPAWVTLDQMLEIFPEVVVNDFVGEEGSTWAIPLYVDTLALYYNRDHYNDAAIASPPGTWATFFDAVEKLTRLDERGRIVRAGAALGAAENVNRSTDILALLMMQSGSDLVSDNHQQVTFDNQLKGPDGLFVPGVDALRFYTDFTDPGKPIYTWNREQDFSIDMFVDGRASMMINYQHHIPTLDAKAPYLNYGIAPVPQVSDEDLSVNYASYWGLGVSRTTDAPTLEAWRFLLWMTGEEQQKMYQSETGRPPAHRALIEQLNSAGRLGVFARQALTARSGYQPDSSAIDDIFADMITSVLLGQRTRLDAVRTAANRIEELLRQ